MINGLRARIGCDIVSIDRVDQLIENPDTVKKIFHSTELERFTAEHLSGIFAVKEAGFKALGLSDTPWLSFEVNYESSGKPILRISNDLLPDTASVDCSISHDGGMAMATVIIML